MIAPFRPGAVRSKTFDNSNIKMILKYKMTNTDVKVEKYNEWEDMVKAEDRDAFNALLKPYLHDLKRAAWRDLRYYTGTGDLEYGQVEAQELVDETFINAWRLKARRPDTLSLKAWLLSVQHRTLEKFIEANKNKPEMVSLEDAARFDESSDADDADEAFWQWYQPDDYQTWEDIIPDDMPTPEEELADKEEENEQVFNYHVRTLYHGHSLSAPEIAYVMRRDVRHVVDILV